VPGARRGLLSPRRHARVSPSGHHVWVAETRWVESPAGADVAYQITGSGGPYLLVQPDWLTNLETDQSYWRPREFIDRLSRIGRVIRIDPRGSGLSDGVLPSAVPSAEDIAEDTVAVLDAIGVEDVILVANGEGGLLAVTFAATHPERVRALVLVNCFPRFCAASDYPVGPPTELVESALLEARERWGTGYSAEFWNPDMADDPSYVEWLARWQRTVAGRSVAFALFRVMYLEMDVRSALSAIAAPTLVLHREHCRAIPSAHGAFIAEAVPDAEFRLLPGADGLIWGVGAEHVLEELAEFVTGARRAPEPERVLATVLFTDIVDSTAAASAAGDATWRRLLERHDDAARREIERHRGRFIKSTGDGVLATFDGPARAIRCARAMQDALQVHGLRIRAGLHVGEIELRGDDIGGIAVHIAARVQSLAHPDEILVSRTVTELVAGSGLEFADRGTHTLKGVQGEWPLYTATNS